jgi:pimeloyl-ACP methyl ester carboxylesterase
VTLRVVDEGDGKPAVLMLAGLAGHLRDWDAVAGRVAARHRVVRYDRPGLGGSAPGRGPTSPTSPPLALLAPLPLPSLAGEVDRIGAVTDRYGLGRPVLVAHSAAALFAEAFARRRPGRVAGLVLVDPSWEDRPRPRGPRCAAAARRAAGLADGFARAGDAVRLPRLVGPLLWRVGTRAMTRAPAPPGIARDWAAGRTAAAAYAEWLAYRDWVADLAVLRRSTPVPEASTVVITALGRMRGGAARRWRSAHERLVAMFPHARQVVLADAGHLVAWDRPDVVAAAVEEVSA